MPRGPGNSRQRMLDSAVSLLRERGASGVTIDAVLAHSGTPRGSVYHHFPGGRNELILSAVRQAGEYVAHLIDRTAIDGDPFAVFERFVRLWKQLLEDTDYLAGCPVVALAVDQREDLPEGAAVAREVFVRWQERLRELLAANGLPAGRATRLATLAVAAIEGAVILCRAERSPEPLDRVVTELAPLYRV